MALLGFRVVFVLFAAAAILGALGVRILLSR